MTSLIMGIHWALDHYSGTEDQLTSLVKSMIIAANIDTQRGIVSELMERFVQHPFQEELNNAKLELRLEEQKQSYFDTLNFKRRPDMGILIKFDTVPVLYLIFEFKVGANRFTSLSNQEQLADNIRTIESYSNAYLIGISEGDYQRDHGQRFVHLLWSEFLSIVSLVADRTGDQVVKKLSSDIEDYKKSNGGILMAFSEQFNEHLDNSVQQMQIQSAGHFNNYKREISAYLTNIYNMLSVEVEGSEINLPAMQLIDRSGHPYYHICTVLTIPIMEDRAIQIHFRVNNVGGKRLVLICELILASHIRDNIERYYEVFEDEATNLWNDDENTEDAKRIENAGRLEFQLSIAHDEELRWTDVDWVRQSKEKLVTGAHRWIQNLIDIEEMIEKS